MPQQFDESYLPEIIQKYLKGTASEEETRFIQSYYAWFDKNPDVLDHLTPQQLQQLKELNLQGIWQKVQSRSRPAVPFYQKRVLKYAAAAAIVLLLGAGTWWWLYRVADHQTLADNTPSGQIVPGGDKATLTLADGSAIVLDRAGNGSLARQGNTQVSKLSDGQIAYDLKPSLQGEALMNTLSTPKGGKYQIILPDGSKAWLNAASSITYPTAFAGPQRNVRVSGEVYLEVAKDKKKPFIVNVDGGSSIEVLGTSFNINAYANEGHARTTLIEGSVKVNHQLLHPGEQYENGQINLVNTGQVTAWKNGFFNLDDADVQTVMRSMERWYDVEVIYQGPVPGHTLAGALPMNAPIEKVVSVLDRIGVHCRTAGKKIIVGP